MKVLTIELDDPWLGKRSFPNTPIDTIKDQYRLLCAMRDDGRKPSAHLLEDIRVYEYIINAPDPKSMADSYLEEATRQRKEKGYGLRKADVAKALGWSGWGHS